MTTNVSKSFNSVLKGSFQYRHSLQEYFSAWLDSFRHDEKMQRNGAHTIDID